jgi:hypothetical protein
MVCKVFRSVVVDTCVDCCAADRAAPTAAPLLEYCENLFAIVATRFPPALGFRHRATAERALCSTRRIRKDGMGLEKCRCKGNQEVPMLAEWVAASGLELQNQANGRLNNEVGRAICKGKP